MSSRTLLVSLLVAAVLAAQGSASRFEGKVIVEGSADTLWVELYENAGHMLAERVPVARDGSFSVSAVGSQLYEVRVVTSHGDKVMSEHVQFRQGQLLEMRVPASRFAGRAPAGPVSALRLAHKPGKMVKKLVREAEELAGAGNLALSAERLTQALEKDPDWFEAWNNLGSRRIGLGQYPEAVEAFRRALAIDPNQAAVHSNLGLAYLFLRKAPEAEKCAARARQLDPGSAQAAYVEGLALLQMNKDTGEAVELLRKAGTVLPRARLAVAEWHCRQGELGPCETELRGFLKTPRGPNHEVAERWMAELKKARKAKGE